MDISTSQCHQDQSNFIKQHKSENGEKIKNMNLQDDDESCWSDSEKMNGSASYNESYKLEKSLNIINSPDQNIQLESHLESTNQINQINGQIQKMATLGQNMSRKRLTYSSYVRGHQNSSDNNQVSTLLQSQRLQLDMDEQTILRTQTNYNTKKMYTSMYNQNEMTKFKQKLRLLTRIKLNIKYFFTNFTSISRTKQLNKKLRKIINDLSDYIPQKKENNIQVLLPFLFKRLNLQFRFNYKLIDPQSNFGFIIKLIMTFVNSFYLFIFSLFIIFQVDSQFEKVMRFSIFIFWIFEILVNINTKIYKAPIVIDSRKLILQQYIKNKAFFDIFPLFVVYLPLSFDHQTFRIIVDILIFTKLPNLIIYHREMQLQLCMRVRKYYFVQLFNLISMLFFIAHNIALIWYLIAVFEQNYLNEPPTWLDDVLTQDRIWWKVYISSLYWSLSLMTTGSNTSITILQTFFTTFVLLFTSIAFGYLLNVIGIILSEMDQRGDNKRKDINIINEYMRKKNISKGLQARVNLNLEYFYANVFRKEEIQDLQVLDKISHELKDSMLIEYNKQILNKIDFLNSRFSPETLDCILLHLKEEYYFPNQIIYFENDTRDQSLMFVIEGEGKQINFKKYKLITKLNKQVELVHSIKKDFKSQTRLEKIKPGQIFGQVSFFTGMARDLCAKSTKFTTIIKIDRKAFIEAIKHNEQEFQEFCQIKDKMLMYKQYNDALLECSVCNDKSHLIQNCSIANFNKEATYKLMGILEKQIQTRKEFERRERLRINTINQISAISRVAHYYIQKLKLECNSQLIKLENTPFEETLNTNQEYDDINSEEDYDEEENADECDDLDYDSDNKEGVRRINSESIRLTDTDINFKKIQRSENNFGQNQKNNIYAARKSVSINDHEDIHQAYENIKQFKKELSEQESRQLPFSSETIRLVGGHRKSTKEISEPSQKHQFNNENNFDERLEPGQASNTKKIGLKRASIKKVQIKNHSRLSSFENNYTTGDSIKTITHDKKINLIFEMLTSIFDRDKSIGRNNTNMSIKTSHHSPKLNYDLQLQDFNPWEFDQLKDYKFYFPHGNSKVMLSKYTRVVKKKQRFVKKMTCKK